MPESRRRIDGSAISYALMAWGSAGLSTVALGVPSQIDRTRLPVFVVALALLFVAGAVVLALGTLTPRSVHPFALVAMAAGWVLVWCTVDPVSRGLAACWFVTVPLFLANSLTRRGVLAYAVVGTVLATALVIVLPAPPLGRLLRCGVTVGLVMFPSAYYLLLRRDLDRALDVARELAVVDSLTGLLNRRGMQEQFALLTAITQRSRTTIAMLAFDVDHFKAINDTLGHAGGDEVLQALGACLRASVRPGDMVVRLGGEEIAVVAPVAGDDEAVAMAERLRLQIAQDCRAWKVTVSVGVATAPVSSVAEAEAALSGLLTTSDHRLYAAKRAGRNRVVGPVTSDAQEREAHRASGAQPSRS